MIKTPDVEFALLKQLEWGAITNGFDDVEKIYGVYITAEPFSEKNGMMTNTKKLRRVEIKQRFKKELEDCYERMEFSPIRQHKPKVAH